LTIFGGISLALGPKQADYGIVKKGRTSDESNEERTVIDEPRLARLLFADGRFGWLWLPGRLYLGCAWRDWLA
jgi:hypothetical protein